MVLESVRAFKILKNTLFARSVLLHLGFVIFLILSCFPLTVCLTGYEGD